MRLWCARWMQVYRVALVAVLVLQCSAPQLLRAEVLTLKNGASVEGALGKVGSLGNPLENAGNGGEIAVKRIIVIDDQLRRTFVGTHQAATTAPSVVTTVEKVKIPQRVAGQGNGIVGVGPIVRVTPFDEWGRRIFTMSTPQGNVDVIQGITEITPTFTKVEAIQGRNNYVWTMPIGTSSIPRETLSKILMHRIDPKNADERLRIVRLYLQSERIQDARMELEKLIADFPELQNLKDQVRALNQMAAQRLIKEIELRRAAGQHQLAYNMLSTFPADGVAGETLLKVRDTVAEYDALRDRGDRAVQQLKQHLAEIKDDTERARAQPICDEIASSLTVHTIDRLADYMRLADDADMAPEQKLALAFSGWILGSGSGIDSLPTAQSLYVIRGLVRRYLISTRKPDRDAILAELNSLEGSTPGNLAKIIANMPPPIETPVAPPPPVVVEEPAAPQPAPVPPPVARPGRFDKTKKAALRGLPRPAERALILANQAAEAPKGKDEKAAPKGDAVLDNARLPAAPAKEQKAADKPKREESDGPVTFAGAPGLLRITTPGLSENPVIEYHVQLPPEYNPNRRYPVVISLNGSGTTPVQQIDWWAGGYNSEADTRFGQGTRHGYIVIAPTWLNEHQRRYEFTAREHAAVLYTLRDACKRFSVDTDKVFLSGHSIGGDAVWDIGLAHPDLWAGVIPIVATADKYVPRYWQNAAKVPLYFVNGEKDGARWMTNASEWDRYLTKTGSDVTVVQYQGRGHEHFYDEIQRLFDWMNEHRRNFFPKDFKVVSMRPWDNFFWYVEVSEFPPSSIVMPVQWPPGRGAYAAETEAKLTTTNLVKVQTAASKVAVYLSPDMIDFSARASVNINGKKHANVQPSIEVLLEDVRTRGDRQHPFWAKVEQ